MTILRVFFLIVTLSLLHISGCHRESPDIEKTTVISPEEGPSKKDVITPLKGHPPYNIVITPATPYRGDALGVEIKGVSPNELSYQWMVNDVDVEEATDRVFHNERLKKGDTVKVRITLKATVEAYLSGEVVIKNSPPTILRAKLSPEIPKRGDVIKVAVETSDRDEDIVSLSYEWYKNNELIFGESRDSLEGTSLARGDKLTVNITPRDGEEDRSTIRLYTTISNTPPTIKKGKTSFKEGIYVLETEGEDPDGDELVFELEKAPEGMKIDSSTGVITWRPSGKDIGKHMVVVSASDGHEGLTKAEFIVKIE